MLLSAFSTLPPKFCIHETKKYSFQKVVLNCKCFQISTSQNTVRAEQMQGQCGAYPCVCKLPHWDAGCQCSDMYVPKLSWNNYVTIRPSRLFKYHLRVSSSIPARLLRPVTLLNSKWLNVEDGSMLQLIRPALVSLSLSLSFFPSRFLSVSPL